MTKDRSISFRVDEQLKRQFDAYVKSRQAVEPDADGGEILRAMLQREIENAARDAIEGETITVRLPAGLSQELSKVATASGLSVDDAAAALLRHALDRLPTAKPLATPRISAKTQDAWHEALIKYGEPIVQATYDVAEAQGDFSQGNIIDLLTLLCATYRWDKYMIDCMRSGRKGVNPRV